MELFKNEKGIAVIIWVILVAVVISGIAYIGYRTYQARHKTTALNTEQLATQATAQVTDPYEGWKDLYLKYEKINLKYPNSLNPVDKSHTGGNVAPGMDDISFTSPSSLKLSINTGLYGIGGTCLGCKIVYSEPISLLGQHYYLNYIDNGNGEGGISYIVVVSNATGWMGVIQGNNIKADNTEKAYIGIVIQYTDLKSKSLETYQKDQNLQILKQIIKSMSY